MANQDVINSKLKNEINHECRLRKAIKRAQSDYVLRQNEARREAEDLKHLAKIQKDYILDIESTD